MKGEIMQKEAAARLIDRVWVLAVALLLLAGVGRLLLCPKEINEYENRYAEQAPAFGVAAYLQTDFQDGLESALADQVPLAQHMKRVYNDSSAAALKPFWSAAMRQYPGHYVRFQDLYSFAEDGELSIVHLPYQLEQQAPALQQRAEALNRLLADNPQVQACVCYIETDVDIDFTSGEKVGSADYLFSQLAPSFQTCCIEVHDFADFCHRFYRTDHHWNHEGSYLCYCQLAELLGIEPLTPCGVLPLDAAFNGSQTAFTLGSDRLLPERVSLYLFDFPPLSIRINGEQVEDYGWQSRYATGAAVPENVSYGLIYGSDDGLVELENEQSDTGNLLLLGESFDNALLKLLASSFTHTYAVDMRNFAAQTGGKFSFGDFVRERQIDRVLFIGSSGYFTNDELMPEG